MSQQNNRKYFKHYLTIFFLGIFCLWIIDVYVGDLYDISPGVFVSGFHPADTVYETGELKCDSAGGLRLGKDYQADMNIYVNNEGFRSQDFVHPSARDSGEIVVMLLGDSHTFGWSAEPLYKSFPDLVREAGFSVYNTGISGSDPAQYLILAKQLIPKYKPDICYVMFCEDNDEQYYEREVSPDAPPQYATNVGLLAGHRCMFMPEYKGPPFKSLNHAYDFYLRNYSLRHKDATLPQRIVAKSNILTLLYREKYWTDPAYPKTWPPGKPKAGKYLKKIRDICTHHQVEFRIAIIPSSFIVTSDEELIRKRNDGIFDSLEIEVPPDLSKADYAENSHFNNDGHRKMADFIIENIINKAK